MNTEIRIELLLQAIARWSVGREEIRRQGRDLPQDAFSVRLVARMEAKVLELMAGVAVPS